MAQEKGIANVAGELKARGFIQDEGGGKAEDFLAEKRKVYHGIDPTADSLHLGNLVQLLFMKHLAEAGHDLTFIVGGGTGMIGDPRESGERVLLDQKIVAKNLAAIKKQLTQILGKQKFEIINNADWLLKLSLVEFLRDTGKHFTVNNLVKREIIRKRLEAEDPISFTEFSYSLLQGYDFWHLNKKYGVDLQIGGSDQWANIISGVDLIRKREGKSAYALTAPIITDKKTGKKFGKSEGNAVWLDPKKTSPFQFYQFWLNVSDESAPDYLKIFTSLSLDNIESTMVEHDADPATRIAQTRLAHEVTTLIHGAKAADAAAKVSGILYGGGSLSDLDAAELAFIKKEVPMTKSKAGAKLTDVLAECGLASSKGEARRLIEQKGIVLNDVTVEDVNASLTSGDFQKGIVFLKRGKKVALLSKYI